ncbi:uncharacterized protein [Temnothorax longispinosus]|uniref:uncharacterized protein n=1 Tax=Temnothorax longispinosus TaxID=300112 RepID=UPI003A9A0036
MNTHGANYYVPIQDETCEKQHNDFGKPRYTPCILGRRFALTSTAYKFLDVGINAGPMSSVDILIGDNRGNRIILPHATWVTFIEKRADVQRLVQSSAPSSLTFRDLELVKIRDADPLLKKACYLSEFRLYRKIEASFSAMPIGYLDLNGAREARASVVSSIIKLTSCGTSLYMKPSTVLFLFELEHCVENVYFQLCQNVVHGVSEKFKQFVTILRQNCITDKCNAVTILREIYDKNSIIDYELHISLRFGYYCV